MSLKLLDITREIGIVTYDYPFGDYEVHEGFRGKPHYEYEKCIGCAACAIACPPNAINVSYLKDEDKSKWEFDCGRCIFCARCEEVCPTGAIYLTKEFENSVRFNKEDLLQIGELEVVRCRVCNKPFTTKRLINYVIERLEKTRVVMNEEKIELLHTCPECKKNQAVEQFTKSVRYGGFK
ncbi:4Fe-4S dicluster domain-containing protein [Caminibacter mediatlanticus TB-2]|uniref:4Fe-4S dicluster domain-containing protein n=1 Tax=Caminibacter mediatlanticus TB-2 TaxID=391592 RepID=A0ABX5VC29_9BACT|nr:formate hydrogenlyase complex iron-sulfur subunit [Caminibacter mediatlanticus]QCT95204.1 4Fe-4S dicluster domain-containing protein [Caminibacter mediatlanticus TB-2]